MLFSQVKGHSPAHQPFRYAVRSHLLWFDFPSPRDRQAMEKGRAGQYRWRGFGYRWDNSLSAWSMIGEHPNRDEGDLCLYTKSAHVLKGGGPIDLDDSGFSFASFALPFVLEPTCHEKDESAALLLFLKMLPVSDISLLFFLEMLPASAVSLFPVVLLENSACVRLYGMEMYATCSSPCNDLLALRFMSRQLATPTEGLRQASLCLPQVGRVRLLVATEAKIDTRCRECMRGDFFKPIDLKDLERQHCALPSPSSSCFILPPPQSRISYRGTEDDLSIVFLPGGMYATLFCSYQYRVTTTLGTTRKSVVIEGRARSSLDRRRRRVIETSWVKVLELAQGQQYLPIVALEQVWDPNCKICRMARLMNSEVSESAKVVSALNFLSMYARWPSHEPLSTLKISAALQDRSPSERLKSRCYGSKQIDAIEEGKKVRLLNPVRHVSESSLFSATSLCRARNVCAGIRCTPPVAQNKVRVSQGPETAQLLLSSATSALDHERLSSFLGAVETVLFDLPSNEIWNVMEMDKPGNREGQVSCPASTEHLTGFMREVRMIAADAGAPDSDEVLMAAHLSMQIIVNGCCRELRILVSDDYSGKHSRFGHASTGISAWDVRDLPANAHLCSTELRTVARESRHCRSTAAMASNHKGLSTITLALRTDVDLRHQFYASPHGAKWDVFELAGGSQKQVGEADGTYQYGGQVSTEGRWDCERTCQPPFLTKTHWAQSTPCRLRLCWRSLFGSLSWMRVRGVTSDSAGQQCDGATTTHRCNGKIGVGDDLQKRLEGVKLAEEEKLTAPHRIQFNGSELSTQPQEPCARGCAARTLKPHDDTATSMSGRFWSRRIDSLSRNNWRCPTLKGSSRPIRITLAHRCLATTVEPAWLPQPSDVSLWLCTFTFVPLELPHLANNNESKCDPTGGHTRHITNSTFGKKLSKVWLEIEQNGSCNAFCWRLLITPLPPSPPLRLQGLWLSIDTAVSYRDQLIFSSRSTSAEELGEEVQLFDNFDEFTTKRTTYCHHTDSDTINPVSSSRQSFCIFLSQTTRDEMASTQAPHQPPPPPPPNAFPPTTVIVTLVAPPSSSLARLTFSDGYEYTFVRHHLLHTAVAYRDLDMRSPNQLLAITGDAEIKTKLAAQWIDDGAQYNTAGWNFWYSRILATQRFQAWRVDELKPVQRHERLAREKSTTLEALVGAVTVGCQFHHPTVERVMCALGIFWLYEDEEKAALRQLSNLGGEPFPRWRHRPRATTSIGIILFHDHVQTLQIPKSAPDLTISNIDRIQRCKPQSRDERSTENTPSSTHKRSNGQQEPTVTTSQATYSPPCTRTTRCTRSGDWWYDIGAAHVANQQAADIARLDHREHQVPQVGFGLYASNVLCRFAEFYSFFLGLGLLVFKCTPAIAFTFAMASTLALTRIATDHCNTFLIDTVHAQLQLGRDVNFNDKEKSNVYSKKKRDVYNKPPSKETRFLLSKFEFDHVTENNEAWKTAPGMSPAGIHGPYASLAQGFSIDTFFSREQQPLRLMMNETFPIVSKPGELQSSFTAGGSPLHQFRRFVEEHLPDLSISGSLGNWQGESEATTLGNAAGIGSGLLTYSPVADMIQLTSSRCRAPTQIPYHATQFNGAFKSSINHLRVLTASPTWLLLSDHQELPWFRISDHTSAIYTPRPELMLSSTSSESRYVALLSPSPIELVGPLPLRGDTPYHCGFAATMTAGAQCLMKLNWRSFDRGITLFAYRALYKVLTAIPAWDEAKVGLVAVCALIAEIVTLQHTPRLDRKLLRLAMLVQRRVEAYRTLGAQQLHSRITFSMIALYAKIVPSGMRSRRLIRPSHGENQLRAARIDADRGYANSKYGIESRSLIAPPTQLWKFGHVYCENDGGKPFARGKGVVSTWGRIMAVLYYDRGHTKPTPASRHLSSQYRPRLLMLGLVGSHIGQDVVWHCHDIDLSLPVDVRGFQRKLCGRNGVKPLVIRLSSMDLLIEPSSFIEFAHGSPEGIVGQASAFACLNISASYRVWVWNANWVSLPRRENDIAILLVGHFGLLRLLLDVFAIIAFIIPLLHRPEEQTPHVPAVLFIFLRAILSPLASCMYWSVPEPGRLESPTQRCEYPGKLTVLRRRRDRCEKSAGNFFKTVNEWFLSQKRKELKSSGLFQAETVTSVRVPRAASNRFDIKKMRPALPYLSCEQMAKIQRGSSYYDNQLEAEKLKNMLSKKFHIKKMLPALLRTITMKLRIDDKKETKGSSCKCSTHPHQSCGKHDWCARPWGFSNGCCEAPSQGPGESGKDIHTCTQSILLAALARQSTSLELLTELNGLVNRPLAHLHQICRAITNAALPHVYLPAFLHYHNGPHFLEPIVFFCAFCHQNAPATPSDSGYVHETQGERQVLHLWTTHAAPLALQPAIYTTYRIGLPPCRRLRKAGTLLRRSQRGHTERLEGERHRTRSNYHQNHRPRQWVRIHSADTERHTNITINAYNLVVSLDRLSNTFSQPRLLKETLTVKGSAIGTQGIPIFNHRLTKLSDTTKRTRHSIHKWLMEYLAQMEDASEFWKHDKINGISILKAPANGNYLDDREGYRPGWLKALFGGWAFIRRMRVIWHENDVQGVAYRGAEKAPFASYIAVDRCGAPCVHSPRSYCLSRPNTSVALPMEYPPITQTGTISSPISSLERLKSDEKKYGRSQG
ncbi:uncharacterized protein MYCFIDRAFT_175139 [Pseudocercospora fijiensis CIRAD86]|uniref:Uncharacterized protein n=1 Tax=Pseudocercospora fijiensis (strain CIRAD86) TaxID=383855 RepID=M2Z1M0_PSEFD|nr:uncharacterized protein MYCFIDRAFT_175139 [Pseudocercospora fijiensis CIRAD86]EME83720.1 hypothetical protein MYCFIDRAFT_175139 [Pseudocercospora fijiensis CIRAD86]